MAVFAGMCNGSFALPMKFTAKWKWEHIWGLFSFWGFVVFPVLLGIVTVPKLLDIFREVGATDLMYVFMFGFLWGIGSICFGLGIKYLGIGLAFSVNVGITIAIGSLLPLFQGNTIPTINNSAIAVIIGVIIIVIGVAINGYAAFLREKDLSNNAGSSSNSRPSSKNVFVIGIMLCLTAGVMSPMLQFAFMYGGKIIKVASGMGVDATIASNAIWMIALFGGFVVNIFFVGYLLIKNQSWRLYKIKEAKKYHLLALIMGLLWVITIACYGMAVSNMGDLGLSIGWAIFNSVGIITANLLGLLTKEWQHVRRKTIFVVSFGLFVLVLGTCVVGLAQFLKP